MAEVTESDLRVDPEREQAYADASGLYVRAIGTDGKWDSFDVLQLDKESFLAFVEREGPLNKWAKSCFLGIFRYSREE